MLVGELLNLVIRKKSWSSLWGNRTKSQRTAECRPFFLFPVQPKHAEPAHTTPVQPHGTSAAATSQIQASAARHGYGPSGQIESASSSTSAVRQRRSLAARKTAAALPAQIGPAPPLPPPSTAGRRRRGRRRRPRNTRAGLSLWVERPPKPLARATREAWERGGKGGGRWGERALTPDRRRWGRWRRRALYRRRRRTPSLDPSLRFRRAGLLPPWAAALSVCPPRWKLYLAPFHPPFILNPMDKIV